MWKQNQSWVITIPKAFAKLLDKDKEYTIQIMEVEKKRGVQNEFRKIRKKNKVVAKEKERVYTDMFA